MLSKLYGFYELCQLIDNVQLEPLALFLSGVEQQTANGFDGATFATDDPSHIAFANANFDLHGSAVRNFRHFDRFRLSDKRFDDFFNGFFHLFIYHKDTKNTK